MKHAFLIIAHNNWSQLKEVMRVYDSKICDFYIHINSMVDVEDSELKQIQTVTKYSKVYFVQRIPIVWGEVGILEASLILLRDAFENQYDYYHLVTGSDLPLVNLNKFDSFFLNNQYKNKSNGKYKTNYVSVTVPTKKIASRVEQYNFFVKHWRNPNKYLRKIATSSSTLMCILQRCIRINRIKQTGWKLYTGSSWWSISHEFAESYLKNSDVIYKQYHYMTFAADEFAIQTLIMNSDFRKSLYEPENNLSANLRLLDFSRGNGYGSPHVYTIDDLPEIQDTRNLIGRKFDENCDGKIVKHILKSLNDED
ncbi:hypothetical protein CHR60_11645 [Faecalibacterium prausnitzii]|uniref:Peptide O-xylosyltransferase n=1 Tax=Faecalibacterium prausnitzii TaxID=853 RepID=A0A2A7B2T2_9FIRM|nr:beta-1,6-N-acetylglucosaminyltransferase [Faecalibacterium prausnitzii]PDX85694.1 hypothetical protein CHR60_11645 [Faecalibacterium prausnitzii]